MPSEERDALVRRALDALGGPRERFHSSLVATRDQVRGLLGARAASPSERAAREGAELGAFAAGRIDVERFAAFSGRREPLDAGSTDGLVLAARTLESLLERGDELYRARVEPDGDLRDTVEAALAEAGRAFGAARAAELARGGRYVADDHEAWLEHFPPSSWSRRERSVAPPLVVEVEGRDLHAAGLAGFLDGGQKIVLLVSGKAPPAPLVRLITPGVWVMQTPDAESLAGIGEIEGPAVAAVFDSKTSRFVHHPSANGRAPRLAVEHVPEEDPRSSLGHLSVFQQVEDLRQLRALARCASVGYVGSETPAETGAAADESAADRLAAWILRQADLSGLG